MPSHIMKKTVFVFKYLLFHTDTIWSYTNFSLKAMTQNLKVTAKGFIRFSPTALGLDECFYFSVIKHPTECWIWLLSYILFSTLASMMIKTELALILQFLWKKNSPRIFLSYLSVCNGSKNFGAFPPYVEWN